ANSILFTTRSGANAIADRMVIKGNGNVGIGTTSTSGTLDVNGTSYQRGVLRFPDYVFEPNYPLESIEQHGEKMWREKHLPGMSPRSLDEQGREILDLGDNQRGLLEELEKAHIYIERLDQRIKALEEELQTLKHRGRESHKNEQMRRATE